MKSSAKAFPFDRRFFPKMMKGTQTGVIVMMHDETSGTVIYNDGTGGGQVGHYSDNWAPSAFVDFIGSVTIESE